ncbi:OprO/OprP family phosphate-selective porin [Lysobacter sp. S4-A87]|uniref:OprO/OprP family phosphate-selective porin n=1 Tax=Lysobacter sp. S4-A87 TaxID=2925843 RepID=UPI001F53B798|nr:OprO/OprP family phosphate-selective porin [Lysobacter sp. S4-A87]UNK49443.1 OprO/OprP family phosphate-selective porin [Lysobacter sp. S4-A87]
MKLSRSTLSVALLAVLAAPAAHAEIAFDVIGGSEISFEGLVQADYNYFDNDFANLNGDAPDGKDSDNELRRAELVLKGKGPGNIDWVIGYDAKADKWLDVNAKYKLGGDANHWLQMGQFKQPNSLEELSSTKNNDFISKSLVTNTFGIARRLGAAYHYGTNDWGLTASYFTRELTEHPAPTPHGPGFGFRGNWAPINEKGNILHFGLSFIDYDTFADTVRIRARPDADLAGQRIVDTGNLTNADRQQTIGGEAMWVTGPFKLQGEYMQSTVERYNNGNPRQSKDFDGSSWYISGLWNITGETWGYKDGVPTTPLPDSPASGMWQAGLRFDTIDLDDGTAIPGATPTAASVVDGVLGGQMDTWTVGVNWYWRSNFKFMLNYVMVDSSRYFVRTPAAPYADIPANNNVLVNRKVDDNPNILEARVQLYW